MSNKEPSKAEVLRGTLDLMVLQTLDALGPQHGYAIGARLELVSAGALTRKMGTLYPGLMRPARPFGGGCVQARVLADWCRFGGGDARRLPRRSVRADRTDRRGAGVPPH